MKKLFTLKHLLVLVMLFGSMMTQAADLITEQVVVNLDEPGTLSSKIGVSKKYKVTNLKLIGDFNGTDLKLLRDMAGSNVDGKSTSGQLSILDLSEANIVRGGESYYSDGWVNYKTQNDVIYDFSFKGCEVLTNLSLPNSVKSIGKAAFRDCSSLERITMPASIVRIGEAAFRGCTSLENFEFPNGVTIVGESTFLGCSSLTSVVLPLSLEKIENSAFSHCCKLEMLDVPSTVSTIGDGAFSGCSSLSKINLPSNLTVIGVSTFLGCTSLKNIDIPQNVTTIGTSAFQECSALTKIVIPVSVTTIDIGAFYKCSNLQSITVGWEAPIELGNSAFSGVPKQCILYIPKGTYDNYWLTDWGVFENIVEYETTSVAKVYTSTDAKEVSRYSANGLRLSVPTKGLNIVKYSDGSVKKVTVQ